MMQRVRIIGRSSSHFTRVTRIFAAELGVAYELQPLYDMSSLDPAMYGGHPAMKVPNMQIDGRTVFGMQNICRSLARIAPRRATIVWPETIDDDLLANAQELVLHSMATQVQIILGTVVAKLPASSPFFSKLQIGFTNCLAWLDRELPSVLKALPPRDLSLLEVTLYCLIDHLRLRPTISLEPYAQLGRFREHYGMRESVQQTQYFFDQPPA
jgi:glutathione S-transferase